MNWQVKLRTLAAVMLLLGASGVAHAAPLLEDARAHAHLEEMETRGILRDPLWAQAYWVQALGAPTDAARVSDLEWALRFDPDFTRARWSLALTLARQGDPGFAAQALTCLTRGLRSFPFQGRLLYLVLTVGGGAVAGTLLLLAILAITKSIPQIRHGILEKLQFLPIEVRRGATVLSLLFPVVLAVTLPPTAALFWFVLLGMGAAWTFLSRWDRRVCVGALAAVLLAPLGLAAWTQITEVSLPGSYLRMLWAAQSLEDTPFGDLRTPPAPARKDPDYYATRALIERRANRLVESAKLLEAAIAMDAERWPYHNNLGNLRLLQGRPDEALAAYDVAARLAPDEPVIYLNRAQAWVEKLEFKKADDSIQRAIDLGSRLTGTLGADADEVIVRDHALGSLEIWSRFAEGAFVPSALSSSQLVSMALAPLLPMRPFWLSAPLFLALFYAFQTRKLARVQRCSGCRGFVCRKCHYRIHRKSYCASCYQIRQEVRAPLKRDEMLETARRRTARPSFATGLALSIVLPGSGHWITGSPRTAATYVTVVLSLVLAVAGAELWPDPTPILGNETSRLPFLVAGVLFALIASASARGYVKSARRRIEKDEEIPLSGRRA